MKTYQFWELDQEVQQQIVDYYIYNCDLIEEESPEAYDALFNSYDWENPRENFEVYLCREIEPAVWELYED